MVEFHKKLISRKYLHATLKHCIYVCFQLNTRWEALEIPRTALACFVALLYARFIPRAGQENSHKRIGNPSTEFSVHKRHVSCEMLLKKKKLISTLCPLCLLIFSLLRGRKLTIPLLSLTTYIYSYIFKHTHIFFPLSRHFWHKTKLLVKFQLWTCNQTNTFPLNPL